MISIPVYEVVLLASAISSSFDDNNNGVKTALDEEFACGVKQFETTSKISPIWGFLEISYWELLLSYKYDMLRNIRCQNENLGTYPSFFDTVFYDKREDSYNEWGFLEALVTIYCVVWAIQGLTYLFVFGRLVRR